MTTPTRDGRRPRWVLAFLAAVLAVAVGLFGATTASAITGPAAQTRVGASTSAAPALVGASASVVPGQRLGNDLAQRQIVVATGVAANSAPSLRSLAEQIRTAGRPGAAVNQRTIAVGEDAAGNLYAGSSGGFDAGQRAAADSLSITRVPSRTVAGEALHAEENLAGAVPDLQRVGTSVRMPCGPSEHNCAAMLDDLGVVVDR